MKLTQFPIQTETGLTWTSREDYLSINLGRWNKQYGDIFTRRKLIDMLAMVEGNFKCSPQEEESVQSVWREMREDIELAKNPPCEVVEVEAVVEPAQEFEPVPETDTIDAALASHDAAELEVMRGAELDINAGQALGNVLQRFDLGAELTQCVPREGTTGAEIGEALRAVKNTQSWTEWAWGDLINYLEDDLGYANVIPHVCSFFHIEDQYQTISRYARTAKAIPPEMRHQDLHFSHFAEIACARYDKDEGKQKEKIAELVQNARKEGWNVMQTRSKVSEAKGKPPKPTSPPVPLVTSKLGRYIVIYRGQDCQNSYSCDQLPDPDEEHVVVDTQDALISCHLCGGTPSWIPLPKEQLEQTALTPEVEGV